MEEKEAPKVLVGALGGCNVVSAWLPLWGRDRAPIRLLAITVSHALVQIIRFGVSGHLGGGPALQVGPGPPKLG